MAKSTNRKQSRHAPQVFNDLCRHVRTKGMVVNMNDPDPDGKQRLQNQDPNSLPYDVTTWWCTQTFKQLGPDDRPCHGERCVQGRVCFETDRPDVA